MLAIRCSAAERITKQVAAAVVVLFGILAVNVYAETAVAIFVSIKRAVVAVVIKRVANLPITPMYLYVIAAIQRVRRL